MKKTFLLFTLLVTALAGWAEDVRVSVVRYAGPFPLRQPYQIDSVNVNSEHYKATTLLDKKLSVDVLRDGRTISDQVLPGTSHGQSIHLLGFAVENTRYAKAALHIKGLKHYTCFVDGKEQVGEELILEPKTHEFVVQYLSDEQSQDSLDIVLSTEQKGLLSLREDGKRLYQIHDVLDNERFGGAKLSASGKYLMVNYRINQEGGKQQSRSRIICVDTGKLLAERSEFLRWMPGSDQYFYKRSTVNGQELVSVHPENGTETILADQLPEGSFQMSPQGDYLLYTLIQQGPKEKEEIYEILEPDDRQPGWRNRAYLAKYDMNSGLMQPLTHGYHNTWGLDISADGRYILLMASESRLTARPTTLSSLLLLDLHTMQVEKLVDKDGFIANAGFSPDGTQIFITGSGEALQGIGKNVKEGQIPSMYDYQLYLMNLADKKVTPVTKNFNPSVQQVEWSKADHKIYFTAENRDYISLYQLDPKRGEIKELPVEEDLVKSFSLSEQGNKLAYYGQSASNSDRLYTLDIKKGKNLLVDDLSKKTLKDIQLGECHAWNFLSSRGDTIYGRYYLPPHFDAKKKYPMIVNYYGGCSPVERSFESRYPQHAYAALGYVVYVVEPSGASGFGQEFAARHVNTAGEGPAQDIIEGTKQFCKEHAFVNEKKIGCIGASYGGFMTQYLQTKTDIFAAAISHAGISDHTSYWGEGYWGYSYSEVSMANSYPWKNKELYVDRSPLFNAEKIHTPLLFLHGDKDTNVPVGESIQMYTALKLLGRETAMVLVQGQDHHILDYDKRIQWTNTIFAWFAKWLQDDATWWNALYNPKSL